MYYVVFYTYVQLPGSTEHEQTIVINLQKTIQEVYRGMVIPKHKVCCGNSYPFLTSHLYLLYVSSITLSVAATLAHRESGRREALAGVKSASSHDTLLLRGESE